MRRTALTRVQPTDSTHRVTTLELFFDLVFVFAFTQVTQLMADDPTPVGALRGLVVLALLWWAWCSYAWLGNQAHADEGVVRLTLIVAMAAMFVVALTIPEAFADLPGGLFAPFVFAACYAAVRLLHLGCYLIAAGEDAGLRRQLLLTAVPVTAAVALLVAGGALGPPYQTVLWALALLVDYTGIWLVGTTGWRVHSPVHFAERHGLIVIVALGESLVAIGVGVAEQPVSAAVIAASILGIVVATSLWWLYFDVVAHVAEGVLTSAQGQARSRLARDSYTYLHFPIVISVIFLALGLKKVLEYVADTEQHALSDALTGVPLIALYGGVAVHLLGHVGFRRRNVGSWNPHRTATAAVLLLLIPVAWQLPALAALAVLAGVLAALVGYEVVRFRRPRAQVRHHPPAAP
ncbi:low temperature requirement protein A [Kocuria sediminis]|uniref:Low temperature requirement protein A n=1 Tax=Kocuria sediminis TaxID=1038857 RepID=A0A6N8GKQ0_9MICC|nr:low temperature requirement protein A [Kocuria sediminis]MUN63681.1 low temperature requirement protein A [Kocuria sediminis]